MHERLTTDELRDTIWNNLHAAENLLDDASETLDGEQERNSALRATAHLQLATLAREILDDE